MKQTKLNSISTIGDYESYKRAGDKEKIANLIYVRFDERYLAPFVGNKAKNGFSMMAVACLMIEALNSFYKGEKRNNQAGRKAFKEFFERSDSLELFAAYSIDFYKNVRCGILHQGETYNGWKIKRIGKLLDIDTKTINATAFHQSLKGDLKAYTKQLTEVSITNKLWENALRKLDYICHNCKT